MRDKRRHVLVESTTKITDDEKTFAHNLYKELIRVIGEVDYHIVNPRFMKLIDGNRFIIRCDLDGMHKLILAFALIKRINGAETAFYTLKSSGTMRALMQQKE